MRVILLACVIGLSVGCLPRAARRATPELGSAKWCEMVAAITAAARPRIERTCGIQLPKARVRVIDSDGQSCEAERWWVGKGACPGGATADFDRSEFGLRIDLKETGDAYGFDATYGQLGYQCAPYDLSGCGAVAGKATEKDGGWTVEVSSDSL